MFDGFACVLNAFLIAGAKEFFEDFSVAGDCAAGEFSFEGVRMGIGGGMVKKGCFAVEDDGETVDDGEKGFSAKGG